MSGIVSPVSGVPAASSWASWLSQMHSKSVAERDADVTDTFDITLEDYLNALSMESTQVSDYLFSDTQRNGRWRITLEDWRALGTYRSTTWIVFMRVLCLLEGLLERGNTVLLCRSCLMF